MVGLAGLGRLRSGPVEAPGGADPPGEGGVGALAELLALPRPRGVVAGQLLADGTPLGGMTEPEDIASAVVFLASDDAGFVTGQVLSVSGGLTVVG